MGLPKAALTAGLLEELQDALNHGNVAKRVNTLRRVTDLFLNAPLEYSDEQIDVFDDVFHCLIQQIETSAKALLASRLAPVAKAPPRLIHELAFDDLVEVASPVLALSEQLDDATLIENARIKSQGHLLAISKRKTLSGAVTDVLVERGNAEVVESTVNNHGANFSERGFSELVSRAEGDDNLATCLGLRPIPRHHYLRLIARASETVRARLQAGHRDDATDISSAVKEVAQQVCAARSDESLRMHGLLQSLHSEGRLNEDQIADFSENNRFEETNAAIALLANIPVSTVENMMIEKRSDGLVVLAKVTGLSWSTLKTILCMRARLAGNDDVPDVSEYQHSYEMLRVSTAQQVLRFYRMQKNTASGPAVPDKS
ncbi:MAG: DUF2336 domain-containing protein [Bradyrhizobiaceae bacterium]|nr:MAG: DUF2336 domain-containing protein [Bradyrhizobiaceae bacterium]